MGWRNVSPPDVSRGWTASANGEPQLLASRAMRRPEYPRAFKASADVSLDKVGRWVLGHRADRVLLVVAGHIDGHQGARYGRGCRIAESILGDGFLERFEADAWPITQLFRKTNTIFVGRFSPQVLERMVAREPNLSRWRYPLPEDLCFFRSSAAIPRFVSVTHQGEAYFFGRTCPAFASDVEIADGVGDHIPLGRYFCSVPKP